MRGYAELENKFEFGIRVLVSPLPNRPYDATCAVQECPRRTVRIQSGLNPRSSLSASPSGVSSVLVVFFPAPWKSVQVRLRCRKLRPCDMSAGDLCGRVRREPWMMGVVV